MIIYRRKRPGKQSQWWKIDSKTTVISIDMTTPMMLSPTGLRKIQYTYTLSRSMPKSYPATSCHLHKGKPAVAMQGPFQKRGLQPFILFLDLAQRYDQLQSEGIIRLSVPNLHNLHLPSFSSISEAIPRLRRSFVCPFTSYISNHVGILRMIAGAVRLRRES